MDFVLYDEEGKPVKENETGELYLIPPSIGLSQTLLNKDHEDAYYRDCPNGPRGEILRRHGDLFLRLANGYYKAQGRSDDTMNLGGIKVSSIELEQIIAEHKLIKENAAVSVQIEGEGREDLIVFAVLRTEIETDSLKKELNAMLARKLNPLFKIANLAIVTELPRTASNKLMRRKLRNIYIQEFFNHGNQDREDE
jgi:acetyl-CoA synthetase